MALATTTLSAAATAIDKTITVALATSFAPLRIVRVDDELMQVTKDYVSGLLVPVLRGISGTAASAHPTTATVVHGLASDNLAPSAQAVVTMPYAPIWRRISYTGAANTLVLPAPGENVHVILNGTTADTFTIPIPTIDITGSRLLVSSNAVSQHVITFTGGLSGAGGSYDVITINATAPASFEAVAIDGLWQLIVNPSGTLTNIAGVLS
jgi:hypothetical protein